MLMASSRATRLSLEQMGTGWNSSTKNQSDVGPLCRSSISVGQNIASYDKQSWIFRYFWSDGSIETSIFNNDGIETGPARWTSFNHEYVFLSGTQNLANPLNVTGWLGPTEPWGRDANWTVFGTGMFSTRTPKVPGKARKIWRLGKTGKWWRARNFTETILQLSKIGKTWRN